MSTDKNPHAQALGRLGGSKNSAAQNAARARNGKLGGRPRKPAYILRCKLCNKYSDITKCETTHPTLPNTLNNLADHNTALWKCPHCGGYN